jgi:hypothetical protein
MANDQMMAQVSTKPGFIAARSERRLDPTLRLTDSWTEYKGDEPRCLSSCMKCGAHHHRALFWATGSSPPSCSSAMDGGRKRGQTGPGLPVGKAGRRQSSSRQGAERKGRREPMKAPDRTTPRSGELLSVFGTKMRSVINLASKPASPPSPSSSWSSTHRS